MEQIKEKVLTEAATSVQDTQVKPLYENSTISSLIMQVIIPTLELIRISGEGERHFGINYSGYFVSVIETKVKDNTHQFVRNWVNVMIDDRIGKEDQVIKNLSEAMDTMCKLLGEVRKELGYGEM